MAFLGAALALTVLSQPGISQTLAVGCMTAALGITSLGEPPPSPPPHVGYSIVSSAR